MTSPHIDAADDAIEYLEKNKVSLPITPIPIVTPQKKLHIVFICEQKIVHYFEDYINTFHNLFEVTIILFNVMEVTEEYMRDQIEKGLHKERFYIFMQYIPPHVLQNIDFYQSIGCKMGIFNTEQLSNKKNAWMINCQHPFFYRVDYSEVNLFILSNENGLNQKKIHLPYQVHLREISHQEIPKDRDVCIIFPYMSERRYKIITELKEKGISVDIIRGFREVRDAELFRYKVLLNVHFADDFNIFEEMRCVRAIFNQMIVVSEKSWYDDLHLLRRHFLVCEYDHIVAKVIDVMVHYDMYHSHLFRSFDKLMPIYDADLQAIARENVEKVWTA